MEQRRFNLLRTWLGTRDSRRSAFRALGAGVLVTGLGGLGLGDVLARKKHRRTNCKKGCPQCQTLKKHKCTCKPRPDGTPCFAGTCAGGVCLSPAADL
jgi:hypothetical protein